MPETMLISCALRLRIFWCIQISNPTFFCELSYGLSQVGLDCLRVEEGEAEETQTDEERNCIDNVAPDDAAAKETQAVAALEQEVPAQPKVPAGPTEPLTSVTVAARASAMFVVGSAEVRASGLPIIGKEPTKELLQIALGATNELCDKHGKALSKSFGNFDRVVALGWLIGDAVGAPLLSRVQAHAVGLKARRIGSEVKADAASIRKDAARKASKLNQEDPRRKKLAAQAQAAEAALLQVTVDLPMPDPDPREQAQASGARKASHAPECDALAAAEAEVLATEKEVKRAMAAVTSAETQENEARKRAERWVARVETLADTDCEPKQFKQAELGARRAKARWDELGLETAFAEKMVLEFKLDLKDAEMGVMLIELEQSLEREVTLRKELTSFMACSSEKKSLVSF